MLATIPEIGGITTINTDNIIGSLIRTPLFGESVSENGSGFERKDEAEDKKNEESIDLSELIKIEKTTASLEERFIDGGELERNVQGAAYVTPYDNFRKARTIYSLASDPTYLVSSLLVQTRVPIVYRAGAPSITGDSIVYTRVYSTNSTFVQFVYSNNGIKYTSKYTASSPVSEFRADYIPKTKFVDLSKTLRVFEHAQKSLISDILRLDLTREIFYQAKRTELARSVIGENTTREYKPQIQYHISQVYSLSPTLEIREVARPIEMSVKNYISFSNPLPRIRLRVEIRELPDYNLTNRLEVRAEPRQTELTFSKYNLTEMSEIAKTISEHAQKPLVFDKTELRFVLEERGGEVLDKKVPYKDNIIVKRYEATNILPPEVKELGLERYIEERLFLPTVRKAIDILSPVPITEQLKLLKQERIENNSRANRATSYRSEERVKSNTSSEPDVNFTIDTKVYDLKKTLEIEKQREIRKQPYRTLDSVVTPKEVYIDNNKIRAIFDHKRKTIVETLTYSDKKIEPINQKRETGYCNVDTESHFYRKAVKFASQRKKYPCGGVLRDRFHLNDPTYRLIEYVRNGEVLGGFLKVDSFEVRNKEGKTRIKIYDQEKNESKPIEEVFDNNTAIAQIDTYLRSIGATPVWERQYYIDTETGKKESGLILTAVAEYHREAKKRLGKEDKGILIFVNGYEPSKGSIPVDKILTKNKAYIDIVYKKNGCLY